MLQHILDLVSKASVSQQLGIIALAVEMGLRLIKSDKPLSLLYTLADGLGMIAQISVKGADLLNKVLPQRLK